MSFAFSSVCLPAEAREPSWQEKTQCRKADEREPMETESNEA